MNNEKLFPLMPRCLDASVPLMAQLSRRDIFKAFRWADRDSGFEKMVVVMLSAAAIIGLLYIAIRFVRYFLKAVHVADSSQGLFENLARQHGLTPNEERLLKGLSTKMGMRSPAALFVRKSLLERELSRYIGIGTGRSAGHPGAQIRALLRKLYSG